MKYQTLVQIYEALTDDLKAAEKRSNFLLPRLKRQIPMGN